MKQKCFSLNKTCFWRPWEDNLSWLQTDKRLSAEEGQWSVPPSGELWQTHGHTHCPPVWQDTSTQPNTATRSTEACNTFIESLKWEQTSLQDLGCSTSPYAEHLLDKSEIWTICTRYKSTHIKELLAALPKHLLKYKFQRVNISSSIHISSLIIFILYFPIINQIKAIKSKQYILLQTNFFAA